MEMDMRSSAEYKDGILRVTKVEAAMSKRVAVKT
jgi:hypothetical protein